MSEILGLATVFTLFTVLVAAVVIGAILSVAYVIDHWEDFRGLFQALGVVLLVFAFWTVMIGAYKSWPAAQAEVEDVRTP